jgi:hypothetical protein
MKSYLRWVALCILGFSNSVYADEFDLYYLGGQSNMEGFGTVAELEPAKREPIAGAWIYQATAVADQQPVTGLGLWAPVQAGHGTGFASDGTSNKLSSRFGVELSFAAQLRKLRPDRKVAIIKYARNGSSIDARAAANWGCWEPDFRAATGEHRDNNQYDQFLATIRNALADNDIDNDGTQDTLYPAGIIWMQGESDGAHSLEVAQAYEQNLKRLMDLMRAGLRVDDLPVVVGRISDSKSQADEKTWKFGAEVRDAQQNFVVHDSAAKLITQTDQYGYSDPWHYNTEGYLDLGKRFADAVAENQAR